MKVETDSKAGPLAGVRVLDFSLAMAGPFAAQKLGDMGAEVTKIEPPGEGEWHRTRAGGDAWVNHHNSSFLAFNRNKRSLAVNLKTQAGRQVVYRLAANADVALLNYRPGVAERLGVDYKSLAAINPALVYCALSGYGSTGPYARLAGQDLVVQGFSGALWNTGRATDPPQAAPYYVCDATAAHVVVEAVLAGLVCRDRQGFGQEIEVNLLSSIVDMQAQELSIYMTGGARPQRSAEPLAHRYIEAPYGIYQTSDGYITISVGDLRVLGKVLGLEDIERFQGHVWEPEARDELYRLVAARLLQRTSGEWLEDLRAADYWAGPVYDYEDLLQDPQVQHNETFVELDHPTEGRLKLIGFPWKFRRTPASIRLAHPDVGQHTEEILDELGYSSEEAAAFVSSGAVGVYRADAGHGAEAPATAKGGSEPANERPSA
jgi:crotonobetainyl-CoA:carnitine CoA-transferase CaiB-like acyl-CoA transferase